MTLSSLPSNSLKEIEFGIWLKEHSPKNLTENLRLVILTTLLEWIALRCQDYQRGPTAEEDTLLTQWLTSWDWSEKEERYNKLMLKVFVIPTYSVWLEKVCRNHKMLGLKFALYSALQINQHIENELVPKSTNLKVNLHRIAHGAWLKAMSEIIPAFQPTQIPIYPASYVESILNTALHNSVITSDQYQCATAMYSLHRNLFSTCDVQELLTMLINSMEPENFSEIPLPIDTV